MEERQAILQKDDPGTITAWAFYDWANSVYALVITSAVFPAYYNTVTRINGSSKVDVFGLTMENTAIYFICLGLAFGMMAVLSPIVSSISDYTGNHKVFMRFFCYLGAGASSALFFFNGRNIEFGLLMLMLATIGYSGSIVFYNAYLPAIATIKKQDRASARGYAFGYIGASTLLILNLACMLNQDALGITDGTLLPRLSMLTTGIWWVGFAQITFNRLPDSIYAKRPHGHIFLNGYRELIKVWETIRQSPVLKRFLTAFFFYIMGVQTVMFISASFGEKEIGLEIHQLILTVLALEYVAIAGAFLFAWLSKRYGNISALTIAVCIWIVICSGAYFIRTPNHFYIAAFFIGMVMGGIQALSRSTYSKLIPKTNDNAVYFGFYDVCEKIAMMLGLVMWGYLDNLFGSMRNAIITVGLWFLLGLLFLVLLRRLKPQIMT